jgi:hypothetical protein
MAHAHVARGEYEAATALLERALADGGPLDAALREEVIAVRGERDRRRRAAAAGGGDLPPVP